MQAMCSGDMPRALYSEKSAPFRMLREITSLMGDCHESQEKKHTWRGRSPRMSRNAMYWFHTLGYSSWMSVNKWE